MKSRERVGAASVVIRALIYREAPPAFPSCLRRLVALECPDAGEIAEHDRRSVARHRRPRENCTFAAPLVSSQDLAHNISPEERSCIALVTVPRHRLISVRAAFRINGN